MLVELTNEDTFYYIKGRVDVCPACLDVLVDVADSLECHCCHACCHVGCLWYSFEDGDMCDNCHDGDD